MPRNCKVVMRDNVIDHNVMLVGDRQVLIVSKKLHAMQSI